MSEAARRFKTNRKIEGKPCGWCQSPLALGDDAAVCSADEAEHHAKCWDDRGGCARPGCANAPLKRLDTPPPAAQSAPPAGGGNAWDQATPYQRPAATSQRPQLRPGYKFCTGCGNQVLQDSQICDFCNAILTPDGIYHGPTVNAPGATAALVYGLIGLLICGIVFGILAIVKAREAKNAISYNPRYGGGGMATAGLVLGIIDLVLWALIVLVRISAVN